VPATGDVHEKGLSGGARALGGAAAVPGRARVQRGQPADHSADPANGSGAEIGGIGLVCILAVGLLVIGAALMLICRFRDPAFFNGQTLRRDTPALIVPE